MKTKLRLLPHWCQIVGYTYLALFLGLILMALVLSVLVQNGFLAADSFIIRIENAIQAPLLQNWDIAGFINFTMFALAAFSKEKVEDEMMTAIRLRSVFVVVMIPFTLHIIAYIAPSGSAVETFALDIINGFMSDFGIMMILYLITFKLLVWIDRWRMRYEE